MENEFRQSSKPYGEGYRPTRQGLFACSEPRSEIAATQITLEIEIRDQVNESLKNIGREFRGTVNVRHLVTLLRDDIGMERIKSTIKYPLNDMKVAIHYGCHLLKPSEVMNVDDPVIPKILQELIEITGATPINHKEYLLCCGKANTHYFTSL